VKVRTPERLYILSTVIICAFVKRLCKSFYRQNDLQNRFTENSESADYAGGQYNQILMLKPDSMFVKRKYGFADPSRTAAGDFFDKFRTYALEFFLINWRLSASISG
jgi:hypothetical protein